MSFVRGENGVILEVLAIFLADIHLSLKAPLWRSAEPDWLAAQARPLAEVRKLQERHKCPVICAGDVVNKWNCSAELINWALEYLPEMYSIPGQHGLPNHQYDDIHRSAYQTLVKAGKIKNLKPMGVTTVKLMNGKRLVLCAYPPGYEIESIISGSQDDKDEGDIWIAVVHDYVWIPGHSYPKTPDEKRLKYYPKHKKYFGYDVIVYGDNHKGFSTTMGRTPIFNCGTLMRRKSDEIDYKPQVGLLLESGKVVPHYLDTSEDKHLDAAEMGGKKERERPDLDMAEFMDELGKLGKSALDFKDAMKQFLHSGKTSPEAEQIILKAMEK